MPNNFPKAISDIKQSMKTISMFKDEYLLDFINTENLGQLCTYLQALDLTVKKPHENPSIGIVLCKEMNKAFVDIVVRNYDSPMGVATYKTKQDMPDVIRHNGMGAKVNIIKYFYTDSSGNLHYKCDEKSSRKLQEP